MTSDTIPAEMVRAVLKSQYRAALAMLRQAIEKCPDDLWSSTIPTNPFWRIAYHTLYYTHLYLQTNQSAFQSWEHHRDGIQHMDNTPGPPEIEDVLDVPHRPSQTGNVYTKVQVLAYCTLCEGMISDAVDALDLNSADSGFSWYKVSKLEHQFISIRHVQHHAAQLADRLRAAIDIGVD